MRRSREDRGPRDVPLEKLFGGASLPAPRRSARWLRYLPLARVKVAVLDVARARADLAQRGYRVPELGRAADRIAEGERLTPRGRHPGRVAEVLQQHLRTVEVPEAYVRLIERSTAAATAIGEAEVWRTSLFDEQAVRVDLDTEVGAVRSRVLRLTAITDGTGPPEIGPRPVTGHDRVDRWLQWLPREVEVPEDPTLAAAAEEILASTRARVEALEIYRDQVLEVNREWHRLRAAEAAELNADRVGDLLADAGADRHRVENLRQLAEESRAAVDGIRQALDLMGQATTRLRDSER